MKKQRKGDRKINTKIYCYVIVLDTHIKNVNKSIWLIAFMSCDERRVSSTHTLNFNPPTQYKKKQFKRLIRTHRERARTHRATHINMLHSFSGNKLINLLEIPHTLTSVKRLKTQIFIYICDHARALVIFLFEYDEGRASLRADIDYNVLLTILSTNRIIYMSIWLVLLKNTRQTGKKEYFSNGVWSKRCTTREFQEQNMLDSEYNTTNACGFDFTKHITWRRTVPFVGHVHV